MNRILLIAEHNGQNLDPATAKSLTCALQIPHQTLDIAVFGSSRAPAESAAKLVGVNRVLFVELPENQAGLAVCLCPLVVELSADYTHVLVPATSFGRDLLPRVAAKLNAAQVSDIVAVDGDRCFKRYVYAGNALITVQAPAGTVVASVRANAFKPTSAGGQAVVETVDLNLELPRHTRLLGLNRSVSERPDLQSASRVLAGGRGVGGKSGFDDLYRLADKLGAAVGASRAAVDAGFVPNDLQIGQTSKIIAPDLYIAFGISGAFQHLAGIKDAGVIVAVNTDPNAPIFEVADIGLVADLFEVIPQLEQALANK
ncbi:electron transfer flavoprotein subunit alpha/FixB family protein [Methylomonas sp. SURF-2]|uniref:Electron transfer flavoprotein subunit alpha/FixB family protein n=1 Tax=Methylomonas subterranea TaxID=2952225 RepID=A0ABT1TIV8_9GAMM|nr:electron transfer flavoprotein subunit alpha/FixB family protein [Methylomonas sp. SURF-2]MCQ8105395.1 electron transfer flavoprotein subunit alpha/FixB family protein [Methylomonas sp. SURF-2]